jgi:oligopeptide/dipeptide ABC transporter ATP-binding protein
MKVGDQLIEALQLHQKKLNRKAAMARAIELLELVSIPQPDQRVKQYPHEFSGGMRQRVMIAMALACNPKLLIADEPTTALDVTIQAQLLELLKREREERQMALILITHDLGVVAGMADRLAVMYAGRIVEEGRTEDVFAHPHHPYTLGLLRSVPRLDGEIVEVLPSIAGTPPPIWDLPSGCPFRPRCEFAFDRCETEDPALADRERGHAAACFADVREAVR